MRLLAGVLFVSTRPRPDRDRSPVRIQRPWSTAGRPLRCTSTRRSARWFRTRTPPNWPSGLRDTDPAIRIAVVPAATLNDGSADKSAAARAYVDKLVDKQQADGIYLVVFGGVDDLGERGRCRHPDRGILTDELDKHSRSDPVGTLNGVMDQLDVPKASSGPPGWLWPLLGVLVLVVAGGVRLPGLRGAVAQG